MDERLYSGETLKLVQTFNRFIQAENDQDEEALRELIYSGTEDTIFSDGYDSGWSMLFCDAIFSNITGIEYDNTQDIHIEIESAAYIHNTNPKSMIIGGSSGYWFIKRDGKFWLENIH